MLNFEVKKVLFDTNDKELQVITLAADVVSILGHRRPNPGEDQGGQQQHQPLQRVRDDALVLDSNEIIQQNSQFHGLHM